MTAASWSALLLFAAGLLHSFSLMCRKLPPVRRSPVYPAAPLGRGALDVSWILIFLAGIRLAFGLSVWLGIVATGIYFVVLPFVFQPPLARLLGFRNLRHYLDTVDKGCRR
jgi:hypothetical protein